MMLIHQKQTSREVFHRMAGCWTYWGYKYNYFDTEEDARAFYDELCYMLANQMAAQIHPNGSMGLTGLMVLMAPHRVTIMLILKQKKLHHQKTRTHVLNLMHASSSLSRMTWYVKVESWICGHEKPDYLNIWVWDRI